MSKIFVLGMHRSGTSAVTGLLKLAGASLGADNPELIGADWSNPKGHFERRDVVRVNEGMMSDEDGSWKKPLFPENPSGGRRQEVRRILKAMGPEPWVIKDPRLSFTIGQWLYECGRSAVCVCPVRNPDDVALSLQRRNAIPLEEGAALAELYMKAVYESTSRPDEFSEAVPIYGVPYSDIMAEPVQTLGRLVDHIPGLHMPPESEIHDFIDPSIATL